MLLGAQQNVINQAPLQVTLQLLQQLTFPKEFDQAVVGT